MSRRRVSGFGALAATHAWMVAGDALVAIALAGSLFFAITPDAARSRVALYLGLTMAPFAVISPLIGPALDRAAGGRRAMVIGSAGVRVVAVGLMALDLSSPLLFPWAFAALVSGKAYQVAKSAVVPGLVTGDAALVEANSKLSVISGLSAFAAALPGLALSHLVGPEAVLGLAGAAFVVAGLTARQLPERAVAIAAVGPQERDELRGAGVILAGSAMGLLRGIVGFLTFLIAFALRQQDRPAWWFGLMVGASAVGSLVGASVAPRLRQRMGEERMLTGALALTAFAALFAANAPSPGAAAALAGTVGLASAVGKLAFDSIVQRDAPDANRGRTFARFETRFQVVWVAGAFVPVLVTLGFGVGFLAIAGAAAFATLSYWAGRRRSARGRHRRRADHETFDDLPEITRPVWMGEE